MTKNTDGKIVEITERKKHEGKQARRRKTRKKIEENGYRT